MCFAREPSVTGRNFARDLSNPIGISFGFRLTQLRKKSKTSDNGRVLLRWHGLPALIPTTALGGTIPSGRGRRAMGLLTTARRHIMPRSCTVCAHSEREAIDRALVGDASNRSVASLYDVSEAAVRRHKANHLPAKLVMAEMASEVATADNLLEQVQHLQQSTLNILAEAEKSKQYRTALSAIREARGNLELLAKLLGELDERPVVNLHVSPEWLELRAVIVGALEPYSEARGAVLRAIEGSGHGRA